VLVNFNKTEEALIRGMHGGMGEISAKIYVNEKGKIISCSLRPGSSIGKHRHNTSDDISYGMSGEGVAVCDGREEHLTAGCCHVCPRGSEHSIVNTGNEDLVIFKMMIERSRFEENHFDCRIHRQE
jgi:mannose-6-phosphate isomerase-like protein (cupin superfamily)